MNKVFICVFSCVDLEEKTFDVQNLTLPLKYTKIKLF